MTVISFPIPQFSNVDIETQYFQPSRFEISDIALGKTTTVTTTTDHNYVIGQLVRILVPSTFGTIQLNEQQGYVLSLPNTDEVEINIDSTQMDAFISSSATTKAQILAIGVNTNGQINADRLNTTVYTPGSFINISP